MSMTQQDWRKLRYPIIGLGVVLVFAGLLISFADQYRQENATALSTQQNLLNQARLKWASLTAGGNTAAQR